MEIHFTVSTSDQDLKEIHHSLQCCTCNVNAHTTYSCLVLSYDIKTGKKGKEVYLYSAHFCSTCKALRHGSHSVTCNYTNACLLSKHNDDDYVVYDRLMRFLFHLSAGHYHVWTVAKQ